MNLQNDNGSRDNTSQRESLINLKEISSNITNAMVRTNDPSSNNSNTEEIDLIDLNPFNDLEENSSQPQAVETQVRVNSNHFPPVETHVRGNPNMFYRKHMGIFLILLSLSPVVLSVFARFGPEDQKPEYLVGLLILLCFLFLLQFLLFVSMIICPKGNKGAIAVLFAAGVCTVIGLILASIAKYRMDIDEEEEAITATAIFFSCLTFILLAVFVGIFNIK